MASAGVALLVFAHDAPLVERAGLIGNVESRHSRGVTPSYRLCLAAEGRCESFSLYRADFRPPLPDLLQLRGSPVQLWIIEGTHDVMAFGVGTALHTAFVFRHPETRTWWIRLWGAGLLFFPTLLVAIFVWARTIGTQRARERPPASGDELPRRGGGYLVALVSALVLIAEGIRVLGAGQIANAYPPAVWLCWTWPVLIQNGLEWLLKRSAAPSVVGRAEGLATLGGIVSALGLFVAPFEFLIAWDAAA